MHQYGALLRELPYRWSLHTLAVTEAQAQLVDQTLSVALLCHELEQILHNALEAVLGDLIRSREAADNIGQRVVDRIDCHMSNS